MLLLKAAFLSFLCITPVLLLNSLTLKFLAGANFRVKVNFHEFLHKYHMDMDDHYPFCAFINMVESETAQQILDLFLEHNKCPFITFTQNNISQKISSQRDSLIHKIDQTTSKVFLFLGNYDEIPQTLDHLFTYPFWNRRKQTHFILSEQMDGLDFLNDTLVLIAKRQLMRFVVIFVYEKLEIYSYNMYEHNEDNKIINVIKTKRNYLSNLMPIGQIVKFNKAPFRVILFNYMMDLRRDKKTGKWTGPDYEFAVNVANALNLTLVKIEPPQRINYSTAVQCLRTDTCDMVGASFLELGELFSEFDKTYPVKIEELSLSVPNADKIPSFQYIFFVFHYSIWICLLVSMFFVAFVSWIILKAHSIEESFAYSSLQTFAGFLQKSIYKLEDEANSVKVLFIVWMGACLIIATAFQTHLTFAFIKPKYYKDLDTIAEVRASGYPIFAIKMYQKVISPEYHLEKNTKWFDNIDQMYANISAQRKMNNSKFVMVGRKTDALKYSNLMVKYYGTTLFHVGSEVLFPSYVCYLLQKNSPFLSSLQNVIHSYSTFSPSLNAIRVSPNKLLKLNTEGQPHTFKMHNLKGVFIIMVIGYCISSLVFVLELIAGKFCKKRNNNFQKKKFKKIK